MAVANTYTLEQSYGSRVMVRGMGFLLNDEMGDFNWTAGGTDQRGNVGTTPNLIAPGKRMLSSQTPVLVLQEGRPFLVTGSPGGRAIINTVLCVVLNVVDFDMDLPAAVAAPRWHHQWLPDQVKFEDIKNGEYQELITVLASMGHSFDPDSGRQGDAHSILIDSSTGIITGVADRRISGKAIGVD
jgi:gamma-glutamyltranspeptidase/glutathione hydrolase